MATRKPKPIELGPEMFIREGGKKDDTALMDELLDNRKAQVVSAKDTAKRVMEEDGLTRAEAKQAYEIQGSLK